MFYKASDTHTSTRDWFALNVDAIDQQLIANAINSDPRDPYREEDPIEEIRNDLDDQIPEWHVEPDEDPESGDRGVTLFSSPDPDAYLDHDPGPTAPTFPASRSEYEEDLAAWRAYDAIAREEHERREGEDLLPMWGTMWTVEDHPEIRAALLAEGLRCYKASAIGIDDRSLLFGADSAGHSFYGVYWIPLRARIARSQLDASEASEAERRALFDLLAEEIKREGENPRALAGVLGVTL